MSAPTVATGRPSDSLARVARVRQFPRQVLDLPEMTVKPLFQLWQGNMRKMAAVKVFERKAELGPKLVERQFLHAGLLENVIGRPPDSGQIVHQRSGPIENNVPNHGRSLMAARLPATHKQPAGRSTNRQIQNGRLAGPSVRLTGRTSRPGPPQPRSDLRATGPEQG